MYERLSHHCVGMRIMFSPVGWCEAAVGAEAPGPSSCPLPPSCSFCSELPPPICSCCSELPPPSCSCCSELPCLPQLQLLTAVCSGRVQPAAVTSLLLHALLQLLQHPHHTHPTLNIGGNFDSLETFGKSSILITFELCKWYSAGKVFWTPCST